MQCVHAKQCQDTHYWISTWKPWLVTVSVCQMHKKHGWHAAKCVGHATKHGRHNAAKVLCTLSRCLAAHTVFWSSTLCFAAANTMLCSMPTPCLAAHTHCALQHTHTVCFAACVLLQHYILCIAAPTLCFAALPSCVLAFQRWLFVQNYLPFPLLPLLPPPSPPPPLPPFPLCSMPAMLCKHYVSKAWWTHAFEEKYHEYS